MENDELKHYGVKGMKWGIRRTPAQLGHKTKPKKKREAADEDSGESKPSAGKRIASAVKNRRAASQQKKAEKKATEEREKSRKKKISEMSDDEIKKRIERLELEKRYTDLIKATAPPVNNKGKQFVEDVLYNSGKNIATQTATYLMGEAVNRAAKQILNEPHMVNPKKGQKDK